MPNERVAKGLEPLLEQIEAKEAELSKLKEAANIYATALGDEPPFPELSTAQETRKDRIKPDQFAKYNAPSTAARAYLEWRGEARGAVTTQEIFDALQRGGFTFENRNPEEAKSGLRVALGKDGLVAKLPNDYYGLNLWYGRQPARKPKTKGEKKEGEDSGETEHAPAPSDVAGPDRTQGN